jgi:hypothetical protein
MDQSNVQPEPLQPVPGLENDPQLSKRTYPLETFTLNTRRYAVRAIEPGKIKLVGHHRTGIMIAKIGTKKSDGSVIFEVRNLIDGAAVWSPQMTSNPHEALRFAAWMKTQFRTHKIYASSPEVQAALKNAGVDELAQEPSAAERSENAEKS